MDYRAKELIRQGDALFNKRGNHLAYWQDAAEQLYPERADFTREFSPGEEFGVHLTSSVPMIMRRDLGNMFSSMLRPRGIDWFSISTSDEEGEEHLSHEAKLWLEAKQITQRNAMYDHVSGFDRAVKQSDHDYVTFGQAALKIEMNYRDTALLVRNRHLRDVVWSEDFTGRIRKVHEKWKPSASQLAGNFSEKKLHPEALKALKDDPEKTFECRHIVLPVEDYERIQPKESTKKFRMPFVSVYIDVENEWVIEESPSRTLKYVIPRWQTVSGSQYSYSQAAVAALPEGRLLQTMTLSLLEAGEKYAGPPMLAVEEALSGGLNLYANGVTYISAKYDERTGEALRPLTQDKSGFGFGLELLDRTRMVLREAFFLDKINLPVMQPGVTLGEIAVRTQEYIRNALPLFDPVESESSAPMCEMIFEEMMVAGFFGNDIPDELAGQGIKFKFKSPLREAEDERKTQSWVGGLNLVRAGMEFDQNIGSIVELRKSLREALKGAGWDEAWTKSDDEMDQIAQSAAQIQQLQQGIDMAGQAGVAAKSVGEAGIAMKEMAA